MVTWHTPCCLKATARLASCLALATLLGCTSIDGPSSDVDQWEKTWKDRAGAAADGAARGAVAVGESIGTAYRGVRDGFEDPDERAFGPYPKGYADAIRRHMIRFEDVPEEASFQFGKPERGYMNAGILAGGDIEWQGWLVDVEIGTKTFAGQTRIRGYVVRMTNGEVEEVHDAAYTDALRRLDGSEPASAAR